MQSAAGRAALADASRRRSAGSALSRISSAVGARGRLQMIGHSKLVGELDMLSPTLAAKIYGQKKQLAADGLAQVNWG